MIGYYATVRDGARSGLLLGPYATREVAEAHVDQAKQLAVRINRDAHWYAYGTARVDTAALPVGRLNTIANHEERAA